MRIVANSRSLAMRGRPASPTCLSLSWETSPTRHKEQPYEYSIEQRVPIVRGKRKGSRGHVGDPARLLVDTARILGESIPLHRSIGCGFRILVRLPDQRNSFAGPASHPAGTRLCAQPRRYLAAVRHLGGSNDGHGHSHECVLLRRGTAWRAPRSQYFVLEVAAGLRSHHGSREGEHSTADSSSARFGNYGRHAVSHAAAEQPSAAGNWRQCRAAMGKFASFANVAAHLLSPSYGACYLACARVLLAAAGFRLGPSRDISMGGVTGRRHRRSREDCLQYHLFRYPGGFTIDRQHGARCLHGCLP